jgi:hypothetical protein
LFSAVRALLRYRAVPGARLESAGPVLELKCADNEFEGLHVSGGHFYSKRFGPNIGRYPIFHEAT